MNNNIFKRLVKKLKDFLLSLLDDGTINYCVKYRYIPTWWKVVPIERMIINQATINAEKDISWYELKFKVCKLLETCAIIPYAMGNKWESDFIYIVSVDIVD